MGEDGRVTLNAVKGTMSAMAPFTTLRVTLPTLARRQLLATSLSSSVRVTEVPCGRTMSRSFVSMAR